MSNYTPPTVPLSVTWEGTDAYTAPTVPLSASWETPTDTATGSFSVQEAGQDVFSAILEQIGIGIPTNLRIVNITRTSARFEWDAAA